MLQQHNTTWCVKLYRSIEQCSGKFSDNFCVDPTQYLQVGEVQTPSSTHTYTHPSPPLLVPMSPNEKYAFGSSCTSDYLFQQLTIKTFSPVKCALERNPVRSTSTVGFHCFLDKLQLFPYLSYHICILPNPLHISNYHLRDTCHDSHILDRIYLEKEPKTVLQNLKMDL